MQLLPAIKPSVLVHSASVQLLVLLLAFVLVTRVASAVPQNKWSLSDLVPINTITPLQDSNSNSIGNSVGELDFTPTQLAAKTRQKFEVIDSNTSSKCKFAVQLFFLQDVSESFKNDLDNVLTFIPAFFEDLLTVYPSSKFAVATFSDYPMPDVGWVRYSPRDHCFKQEVAFTGDTNQIGNGLRGITVVSGRDHKEAQLSALQHVAAGGYFSDSPSGMVSDDMLLPVKLVVLSTDSEYHEAGDLAAELAKHPLYRMDAAKSKYFVSNAGYNVVPNNGDADLACESLYLEDYPSIDQVVQSMQASNVGVLFLVTPNQVQLYKMLAKKMQDAGLIAFVNTVKEDSSDILESLNEGIHDVYAEVCYRGGTPTPLPHPPNTGGDTGDNILTSTPFPNDGNAKDDFVSTIGIMMNSSSTTALFSTGATTEDSSEETVTSLPEGSDHEPSSQPTGGVVLSSTVAPNSTTGYDQTYIPGEEFEGTTGTSTTTTTTTAGSTSSNVAVIVGATAGVAAAGAAAVAAASFFGGAAIFGAGSGAAAAFSGADAQGPPEGADREMETGITADMYA